MDIAILNVTATHCDPLIDCSCLSEESNEYRVGSNLNAGIIIWFVALAGVVVPIASKKFPYLAWNATFMELLMIFGFGVVLSTGCIHMISEGIEQLNTPCIRNVEEFEALGLAIVLVTMLFMQVVDCEFEIFSKKSDFEGSFGDDLTVTIKTSCDNETPVMEDRKENYLHGGGISDKKKKSYISVILFEMAVLMHSIVIGVNLGSVPSSEVQSLLIALCFHQFFEGIAVGSTAIEAYSSWRKLLMVCGGFSMATPTGVILGILVRQTYSNNSATAIWTNGILNCVSGGVLVYTGIVELLTNHLTTNEDFQNKSLGQRLLCYSALWLGGFAMTLLGKWT